jgi:hypothetical protein
MTGDEVGGRSSVIVMPSRAWLVISILAFVLLLVDTAINPTWLGIAAASILALWIAMYSQMRLIVLDNVVRYAPPLGRLVPWSRSRADLKALARVGLWKLGPLSLGGYLMRLADSRGDSLLVSLEGRGWQELVELVADRVRRGGVAISPRGSARLARLVSDETKDSKVAP